MRRYFPHPFSSFHPEPSASSTEAQKHIKDEKHRLPNNGNSSSAQAQAVPSDLPVAVAPSTNGAVTMQQEDAPPSPSSTRQSYLPSVPSLPKAIPSVRKYLFSSSPTASSPNSTSHDAHGHHSHHNPLHHLRRRHSASSSDNVDSLGYVADPVSSSLTELSALVDKNIGPVGQLTEPLAKRLPHDRLLDTLNRSIQDRNRLLVQFLRARQHNAIDAMQMISNAIRWRCSVNIDTYLTNTVQNMRLPNACFPMTVISTPELCKQPVIYGLIRLLDKKQAERVAFHNALLSFLESSYFGDSYVLEEIIIILDFRDWSIRRNAPYRLVKDGIQTLQDYYPERLGRVFLVNYPTTIRAAYTAISPIIDAGAKEKIVWIPDADPSSTLLKFLSPKSIPSFMGGELHASFPPTWPDVEAEFVAGKASSSHGLFHH